MEYHLDCFEAGLDNWAFMGDTVPCFKHEMGADQTAALYGGRLEFNETSSGGALPAEYPRRAGTAA